MVPNSLPEAQMLPDNPGAKSTTGRTGTMARTGGIAHRPPRPARGHDRHTGATRHVSRISQTLA
jgi:hypothetical protein